MYATHANDFSLDHDTRFSKDSVTTGPEGFKLVLHSGNAAMPCVGQHGLGVTQR
ncbi:hypothetical protein MK852_13985 [Shewanella benthica]|uniref:hypothetical protein n=1 Tax=Shewanella benthica TaxID=43661 RepID=UPI00187AFE9A|nr:hypothetical protein [Shewanella benthica]MBE7214775.1 hypothetical protein [Shewanella benthica]MCL1063219.1 hypothetical protein [Shewanella benthica]